MNKNLFKYKCHKEVFASKIEDITEDEDRPHLYAIWLESDGNPESVTVDNDWINKHKPQAGGYFVKYADGYESFSPADAFEAGYTLVGNFETRMIAERDELKAKIEKLGAFISSDQMQDCSAEYQTLLVNQVLYMTDYAITLDRRIVLLDLNE